MACQPLIPEMPAHALDETSNQKWPGVPELNFFFLLPFLVIPCSTLPGIVAFYIETD